MAGRGLIAFLCFGHYGYLGALEGHSGIRHSISVLEASLLSCPDLSILCFLYIFWLGQGVTWVMYVFVLSWGFVGLWGCLPSRCLCMSMFA